jgi:S-adenosylmethionine-diacylgycerolhomoserine-N-methlytransferase
MDPSTSLASPSPDALGLVGLDGFYRWHARIYDWTRPFLLFGRRAAADAVEAQAGQLVLDVGCGTGVSLPRLGRSGASVVGIECTQAMSCRAQARLGRHGLGGRVLLDARPYGPHGDYEGTADRMLFSYSLSMIPPFSAVLERARRDLRTGGRIVVVDFLDAKGLVAHGLERSHVQLGPARLLFLQRLFPDHRLKVVSLGLWRYFLFVGEVGG